MSSSSYYIPPTPTPPKEKSSISWIPQIPSFSKNIIIIILCVLLILAMLGINVILILGNLLQTFIIPLFKQIIGMIAYSLGITIDKSSEVVASTAKTGIDIADGVFDNIGHLLMSVGQPVQPKIPKDVKEIIEKPKYEKDSTANVRPDSHDSPIQRPISAEKAGWCYIGSHNGVRGCVEVEQHDKCMSGQIFTTQKICLSAGK